VLAKEDKKNQLKKTNRKKKINHTKNVCILALWALILEKLSHLIGSCAWSETNAKSFLRH